MTRRLKTPILLLLCLLLLSNALGVSADFRSGKTVFHPEDTTPFEVNSQTLNLYVVPLLGADCMVLTCGGQTMLVDMGKEKDFPQIQAVLASLGIQKIDIAFNTHPHSDHLGSMVKIASALPVAQFYTAFPEEVKGHQVIQQKALKGLSSLSVPITRLNHGDHFAFGDATCQVIQAGRKDVNANSAMLRIQFGERTLLLAADVNRTSQGLFAQSQELQADILKYPHHGQEKLHQDFMQKVDPEFAVFTHGSSGSREGQKWLDIHGVGYLFATWGVITASTDGHKWIVSQEMTEDGLRFRKIWEGRR